MRLLVVASGEGRGGSTPVRSLPEEVAAGIEAASAVVAPTRAMLDELTRHYGARAYARVIANAVSAEHVRPRAKRPYVFVAGRLWDDAKNVAALGAVARSSLGR